MDFDQADDRNMASITAPDQVPEGLAGDGAFSWDGRQSRRAFHACTLPFGSAQGLSSVERQSPSARCASEIPSPRFQSRLCPGRALPWRAPNPPLPRDGLRRGESQTNSNHQRVK